MSQIKRDEEIIRTEHNMARFFTENRQVSTVLLIALILAGYYGYVQMPKRKDPEIPAGIAAVLCLWPGASAERVEQLVTRRIEEKVSENSQVETVESISRGSISVVYVILDKRVTEINREFDDIELRLNSIHDLPQGAGPIQFLKGYGEAAALMLTVASPKASALDISLRADAIRAVLTRARAGLAADHLAQRVAGVICFPYSLDPRSIQRRFQLLAQAMRKAGFARNIEILGGPGFVIMEAEGDSDDETILAYTQRFVRERLQSSEFHRDLWQPAVIRDLSEIEARLRPAAGDRYSYRELAEFTDLISRSLQSQAPVSRVTRTGLLEERIFLDYSQERLAAYGLRPSRLADVLRARNITLPGGILEVEGKNVSISPSGSFGNQQEIANVLISASEQGSPVYLRDVVDISRDYESPPRFLSFYTYRDAEGRWQRGRAITIAAFMKSGEQIGEFGAAIDNALEGLQDRLPEDLILARISDQPRQTAENLDLFMQSLYEAIILVILVALIGFGEWRSSLLMALSIPVALAGTFAIMYILGLDLQQVSIATLILALGLLVDDPVVAGDSIKRELDAGQKPIIAAWLGPTKLVKAITYATITVIVAFLPLLLVTGNTGNFIYSLPLVIVASLVSSRIVSMTFIPFMAYYLLRPRKRPEPTLEEKKRRGFTGIYYRMGVVALQHRWKTVIFSTIVFGVVGWLCARQLRSQFFPMDLSYLSYIDVWLPEDSPFSSTDSTARKVEDVVREVVDEFGREHPDEEGNPRAILDSLTTFVGGGGPRFWFSIRPEQQQLNYAQVIIRVFDKYDTQRLVTPLQQALSARVPGAIVDMRQLETSEPVGVPVAIRISGPEIGTLRHLAEEVKTIFRSVPEADRIRDSWGAESFVVNLEVEPDRANLAGISNLDVAASSAVGMSGYQVTTLREGDKQIPVMVRMRMEDRARLSDVQNLYVYSLESGHRVPLRQVSSLTQRMETEKLIRRNQFRTITVSAFPVPGTLPSEVLGPARRRLTEWANQLPPGYRMEIGGEEEKRLKGFADLGTAMGISVLAIYLALVIQFRHAIKPLIVFAAAPFGMVGAIAALAIMGAPFGFMAFLGLASLIGVIVSHVIVLFDFVEEMREEGHPLQDALLDAGIVRLRPVFVTVASTVIALIPLALHGGPLWESMCYAQIGGLLVANYVTKIVVPAFYAIAVLDLRVVKWETVEVKPA